MSVNEFMEAVSFILFYIVLRGEFMNVRGDNFFRTSDSWAFYWEFSIINTEFEGIGNAFLVENVFAA